jgi:D-alanyl-D-alanine carboxypeptidase/D-alanyl-D-alanine-endopeptidase (penicillin-binding protein 4)
MRCDYVVRAGDTLSAIAARLGTTVAAIARANARDPDAILPIGLRLRISDGGCAAASPAVVSATARSPQSPADAALVDELGAAVRSPGGATSAIAVDLHDGATIYALAATTPLEPASEEKLPVSLAALEALGPSFRTQTKVLSGGSLTGGVLRGDVVLKGYGDPTLSSDGLSSLARQLRALGIRVVAGGVVGDESFFDPARTAPGWKPSFYKNESPPLSALVVDRGMLDGRMVDHPALAAAILFTRALEAAGVQVRGAPRVAVADAADRRLAALASPPLSQLLYWMDSWSDNFFAEMLLKQLGARELGHGTDEAGAEVVARMLEQDGLPRSAFRIADGSGLSLDDRITAQALATILVDAWREPSLRHTLLDALAVAGVSGTLRNRLPAGPGHGIVHAKSGTTDESSALAGYVGRRYAFVVIQNGAPVDTVAAHTAQDRFVQALARATASGSS